MPGVRRRQSFQRPPVSPLLASLREKMTKDVSEEELLSQPLAMKQYMLALLTSWNYADTGPRCQILKEDIPLR